MAGGGGSAPVRLGVGVQALDLADRELATARRLGPAIQAQCLVERRPALGEALDAVPHLKLQAGLPIQQGEQGRPVGFGALRAGSIERLRQGRQRGLGRVPALLL